MVNSERKGRVLGEVLELLDITVLACWRKSGLGCKSSASNPYWPAIIFSLRACRFVGRNAPSGAPALTGRALKQRSCAGHFAIMRLASFGAHD
jgi:hypothetical protein